VTSAMIGMCSLHFIRYQYTGENGSRLLVISIRWILNALKKAL
jgi:hypothetical protein